MGLAARGCSGAASPWHPLSMWVKVERAGTSVVFDFVPVPYLSSKLAYGCWRGRGGSTVVLQMDMRKKSKGVL